MLLSAALTNFDRAALSRRVQRCLQPLQQLLTLDVFVFQLDDGLAAAIRVSVCASTCQSETDNNSFSTQLAVDLNCGMTAMVPVRYRDYVGSHKHENGETGGNAGGVEKGRLPNDCCQSFLCARQSWLRVSGGARRVSVCGNRVAAARTSSKYHDSAPRDPSCHRSDQEEMKRSSPAWGVEMLSRVCSRSEPNSPSSSAASLTTWVARWPVHLCTDCRHELRV